MIIKIVKYNMNTDKLVRILEEYNIKPEIIDEVVIQVSDINEDPVKEREFYDETEILLKSQLGEAVDWQRRAAISAAIISHKLDKLDE